MKEDWYIHPKTGEQIDFVYFARTEGRFAKHFDKDGNPSATLLATQQERLENWHLLAGTGGDPLAATQHREAGYDPNR